MIDDRVFKYLKTATWDERSSFWDKRRGLML
jgi:hypothetical protein